MSDSFATVRAKIIEAIKANPALGTRDPASRARLEEAAADCTFEQLGFDSLARMELSIWLEVEAGIEVAEEDMLAHPSVNALARHLAGGAK